MSTCVFIQIRCKPGKTYQVADQILLRELHSELYSTSGDYDMILKMYIPSDQDVGKYINDNLLDIEHIDWSSVPLVLPSTGQVRKNIDVWLRNQSISPNVYAEVPGNEAILSLVALGCGVGFVPELVIKDSPLADQVVVVEDGPDLENFHVGFCTRKKNLEVSPIIRAFWKSIPVTSLSN